VGNYLGKYRGIVKDTDDKDKKGRIRALVPDVYGENLSGWATPCVPFAGASSGWFALPPRDASVWIEFERGDPDFPIWSGCFWSERDQLPRGADAKHLVLQSPGGHRLIFDDSEGGGGITLETAQGQRVLITPQKVEITNGKRATIELEGPKTSINGDALEVT
jgi:uncharacterized protein involved in type VI secretion and phage assembly